MKKELVPPKIELQIFPVGLISSYISPIPQCLVASPLCRRAFHGWKRCIFRTQVSLPSISSVVACTSRIQHGALARISWSYLRLIPTSMRLDVAVIRELKRGRKSGRKLRWARPEVPKASGLVPSEHENTRHFPRAPTRHSQAVAGIQMPSVGSVKVCGNRQPQSYQHHSEVLKRI